MKNYQFTSDQRERLLDLLYEQLRGVSSGTITGYGQPKDDELQDIDKLITELED